MLAQADTSLSGSLTHHDLPGVMQMLGHAHQTGALHINSGDTDALLFFDAGEIVHAECGTLFGDEAVIHILKSCVRNNSGVYKFVYGSASPQRTVLRSATDLMLDAMRELDESAHSQDQSAEPAPAHQPASVLKASEPQSASSTATGYDHSSIVTLVEELHSPMPFAAPPPAAEATNELAADLAAPHETSEPSSLPDSSGLAHLLEDSAALAPSLDLEPFALPELAQPIEPAVQNDSSAADLAAFLDESAVRPQPSQSPAFPEPSEFSALLEDSPAAPFGETESFASAGSSEHTESTAEPTEQAELAADFNDSLEPSPELESRTPESAPDNVCAELHEPESPETQSQELEVVQDHLQDEVLNPFANYSIAPFDIEEIT